MTTNKTWLDNIVSLHAEYEAPLSFWRWSALAAISAVVKDNVWINRGGLFNQYPNIYVLLYADSGLKKGAPIFMAKQMVKHVNNTKLISGRSSIQGILKILGTAETRPGGQVMNNAACFICASELSSSLVRDEAALTILTDLYDRSWNPGSYDSNLKMEQFTLKNPIPVILGGINEAHASALFEHKDLHGGFLGRTFIIHESKRNRPNSLILDEDVEQNVRDYKEESELLLEISKLRGPFKPLTKRDEAGDYFNTWYLDFIKDLEEKEIKDSTGSMNRLSESVIKVAMLLSLARHQRLEIDMFSLHQAIGLCEQLIGNIRQVTKHEGDATFIKQKTTIMSHLMNREGNAISRTMLNKNFWKEANSQDWDLIMQSLRDGGFIEIEISGKETIYKMPGDVAERLREHFKGKN